MLEQLQESVKNNAGWMGWQSKQQADWNKMRAILHPAQGGCSKVSYRFTFINNIILSPIT